MAKCPNCGVTVAFHGDKRLKCWKCKASLEAKKVQRDGHLLMTVAVLVPPKPKPRRLDRGTIKPQ